MFKELLSCLPGIELEAPKPNITYFYLLKTSWSCQEGLVYCLSGPSSSILDYTPSTLSVSDVTNAYWVDLCSEGYMHVFLIQLELYNFKNTFFFYYINLLFKHIKWPSVFHHFKPKLVLCWLSRSFLFWPHQAYPTNFLPFNYFLFSSDAFLVPNTNPCLSSSVLLFPFSCYTLSTLLTLCSSLCRLSSC